MTSCSGLHYRACLRLDIFPRVRRPIERYSTLSSTLTPTPFDPPQPGIRLLKRPFRDRPVALCPGLKPTSSASCVPCLIVRALCGTAPTCCEHPASRVERGMDTLDKIPPSSLVSDRLHTAHTQLACRKGREFILRPICTRKFALQEASPPSVLPLPPLLTVTTSSLHEDNTRAKETEGRGRGA